ncbi:MOSC domain-containing protein [Novosphingobium colocasiae]|nr:MOSC domain-containing protein [Novosphingobium colocasiae]
MNGRLLGIARHSRPRGPMETVPHVAVTREEGVHGDFRGATRPGRSNRRQITLIEVESWEAALAELSLADGHAAHWSERRANLLISGLSLPRKPGTVVSIGAHLKIEITRECDPCERMEAVVPGLRAALTPDWRGGFCGRVLEDGEIAVGDEIRIEE